MTKDNWIKALEQKLPKMIDCYICEQCAGGGSGAWEGKGQEPCSLCKGRGISIDDCDNLIKFISQVEKDAEERGYQLGLRDGIKKEHEKSESWTELNKQGVINTHKLIKDVIENTRSESYTNGYRDGFDAGVEKTNKRWRERVGNDDELWEYLHNPAFISAKNRLLHMLKEEL